MGEVKKPQSLGVWPTVKPFVNGGASGMLATCVIQPVDMIKVHNCLCFWISKISWGLLLIMFFGFCIICEVKSESFWAETGLVDLGFDGFLKDFVSFRGVNWSVEVCVLMGFCCFGVWCRWGFNWVRDQLLRWRRPWSRMRVLVLFTRFDSGNLLNTGFVAACGVDLVSGFKICAIVWNFIAV